MILSSDAWRAFQRSCSPSGSIARAGRTANPLPNRRTRARRREVVGRAQRPNVEFLAREVAPGLLLIRREQAKDLLDSGLVSLLVIEVNHFSVPLLRDFTRLSDDRLHLALLLVGQRKELDVLGLLNRSRAHHLLLQLP